MAEETKKDMEPPAPSTDIPVAADPAQNGVASETAPLANIDESSAQNEAAQKASSSEEQSSVGKENGTVVSVSDNTGVGGAASTQDNTKATAESNKRFQSRTQEERNRCRLFIGNLATDKTSKEEVDSIFRRYGNILDVSFYRSFGFVQYDSERAVMDAIKGERQTSTCLFFFYLLEVA